METLIERSSSSTAKVKINRNNSKYSIRQLLYPHQDVPDQLIYFLLNQKTGIPICTAVISLDLKTLHYTSTAITKLDVHINPETIDPGPFEIIKARLSLSPESTMHVEILSIPLRQGLRFCLFFQDETTGNKQAKLASGMRNFNAFPLAFICLTAREKEVARMVALGKTSVQLSKELNIAKDTVKNHRKNIRRKLKITTRAEQMKVNDWLRNISVK